MQNKKIVVVGERNDFRENDDNKDDGEAISKSDNESMKMG